MAKDQKGKEGVNHGSHFTEEVEQVPYASLNLIKRSPGVHLIVIYEVI